MNGKAFANGLKRYLGSLVATIVFPILWLRCLRLARRHTDADARAPLKVMVAIAASIGIAAVGAFALISLQSTATAGFYDSMDARLAETLGESEYQSHLETIKSKPGAIATVQSNIAKERAAGNSTTALEEALQAAQSELASAQENKSALETNHLLYLEVQEAAQDQDDERVRQLIEEADLARPKNIPAGVDNAFAVKERASGELRGWMLFIFWPSLAGAFFAPMAFALGSILKRAFVASDTVGFKPYPGGAAGAFLLFGAFGLPSIPFAAWTFLDAESRSIEGQIAL